MKGLPNKPVMSVFENYMCNLHFAGWFSNWNLTPSSESADKLQVLHISDNLLLYVLGKLAMSRVKIFSIFCNRENDLVLKLC